MPDRDRLDDETRSLLAETSQTLPRGVPEYDDLRRRIDAHLDHLQQTRIAALRDYYDTRCTAEQMQGGHWETDTYPSRADREPPEWADEEPDREPSPTQERAWDDQHDGTSLGA